MRNITVTTLSILVAVFILATCGSARAQYTGQTIDGTLAFGPNGINGGQHWDPASVTVPGTFSFGPDGANTDTAAFTDNTLTVTDVVSLNANGWEMTFSDTALPFTELVLVSDNFSPDITFSLSGGVITLDWVGTLSTGTNTAVFDIGAPSTVPEPGSLALLGTGALAFGRLLRRKRA
jgi:PEP-CTERM motif